MAAPRETDLNYYDPIIASASTFAASSLKPSEPQVIYSPAYMEQKKADLRNLLAVPQSTMATSVSKISKDAASNRSLQTLLQSGVIDKTMIEGFMEMGKDFKDWASIQSKNGLTNAQLEVVKSAHAKYFGLSTDEIAPMPTTPPAKKPNFLLWGAIAVGGFFLVRKLIK
jgi:hypothetical protein